MSLSEDELRSRRAALDLRGYLAQLSAFAVIVAVSLYCRFGVRSSSTKLQELRSTSSSWWNAPARHGAAESIKQYALVLMWLGWLIGLCIWKSGEGNVRITATQYRCLEISNSKHGRLIKLQLMLDVLLLTLFARLPPSYQSTGPCLAVTASGAVPPCTDIIPAAIPRCSVCTIARDHHPAANTHGLPPSAGPARRGAPSVCPCGLVSELLHADAGPYVWKLAREAGSGPGRGDWDLWHRGRDAVLGLAGVDGAALERVNTGRGHARRTSQGVLRCSSRTGRRIAGAGLCPCCLCSGLCSGIRWDDRCESDGLSVVGQGPRHRESVMDYMGHIVSRKPSISNNPYEWSIICDDSAVL